MRILLFLFLVQCCNTVLHGQFENQRLLFKHTELINGEWIQSSPANLSLFNDSAARFEKDSTNEVLWIDQKTYEQRLLIHVDGDSLALAPIRNDSTAIALQWTGLQKNIFGKLCQQLQITWTDLKIEAWVFKDTKLSYIPYIALPGIALSYDLIREDARERFELQEIMPLVDLDRADYSISAYQRIDMNGFTKFMSEKFAPKTMGQMPSFSINDIKGASFHSDKTEGDLLLINFWYTQCPPCIKEMPGLNQIAKKYANDRIQFLGITFDDQEIVESFLKHNPFRFRIFSEARAIIDEFNIRAYPTTILVAEDGRIIESFLGGDENTLQEIDGLIQQSLH